MKHIDKCISAIGKIRDLFAELEGAIKVIIDEEKPTNGFYTVTTVDPIPIILEHSNGKWLYPDGTMREFTNVEDILSYVPAAKPEEPFAKVQVGDFIEYDCGNGKKQAIAGKYVMGYTDTIWAKYIDGSGDFNLGIEYITRILKPEEVKVKILLEGTVSPDADNKDYVWVELDNGVRVCLNVNLNIRDPATATLVRELVAKQQKGG